MDEIKANKRLKIAAYINLLIFLMVAFATIGMFFGFLNVGKEVILSEERIHTFKYFTVDSNILMGVIALAAFFRIRKTEEISRRLAVWLLLGTVGVTLTMIVTVGFLTSVVEEPITLFMGSNFFLHLIVPLVSIINICVFERSRVLQIKDTIYALVPVVLYGSAYIINVYLHLENGQSGPDYDWYGFMTFGPKTIIFGLPVMLFVTWLIAYVLYRLNAVNFKHNK